MNLPFQSIRWRIQAWHGLILLVAIVAFCVTAYQFSWQNQNRRIDRGIHRNERQLVQMLIQSNQERLEQENSRVAGHGPFPEELYQLLLVDQVVNLERVSINFSGTESGYSYYAFADEQGRVLLKSGNAPSHLSFLSIPDGEEIKEAMRDRGEFRESLRSFNFGLRIVVGLDISAELSEKHRFGWSLGISGFGLWIVGLIGGWWFAGKAIRPIQSISQTATQIAQGNLNERIRVTSSDSELDQLSRVLNHTFDRLNATLEQQRQFTADASHELRTPLTILLSESQRMRKRIKVREAHEYHEAFDLCHSAAERMRRLVENLLLLARQDGEGPAQAYLECDLATIINASVFALEPLAKTKNISIEYDLPSSPLSTCAELMTIVFNNVIGNAVHHHPGDGVVKINVSKTDENWVVHIIDDGDGISSEDLPRIFDRFYRVDRARNDSEAGHSGLGLALTRTIVENMGSSIEVQSKLNQGSEFVITIPFSSSADAKSVTE